MKDKNIGNEIYRLRKEKNLTQNDLAEKMHVSRETISKWERNIVLPDIKSIGKLCKELDCSYDSFLGMEHKKKEEVVLDFYKIKWQNKKRIKFLIIFFIGVILLFLGYYFFNTYRQIHIYKITGTSDNININEGLVVRSYDKIYFNLGNIEAFDEEIKGLELYTEEKSIFKTNGDTIFISDFSGYNEYFDHKEFMKYIDCLYLKVIYENEEDILKLDIKEIYVNADLSFKEKPVIEDNTQDLLEVRSRYEEQINDIKKSFQYENNEYFYQEDRLRITYNDDEKIIKVSKGKEKKEEWEFSFLDEIMAYSIYEGDTLREYIRIYGVENPTFNRNEELGKEKLQEFFSILDKVLK